MFYDTASSASSSPPLRHRLRRTRSPSPARHHAPARPYSPSSREADIARLLDPAYASPPTHTPLTRSPRMPLKEVYVDHYGDLHDPDFRDFPPFGHSHMHSRQPRWERGDVDDVDSDDEDAQIEQQRSSFDHQRRRPSSSTIYHPPPVYLPYDDPASYESRYLAEDEEGEQLVHAPFREKSGGRPRSPPKRASGPDEKRPQADHVIQADSDWTPTCTQNLRRQWQAITLSLRFSLFRTKRRLRHRLTG